MFGHGPFGSCTLGTLFGHMPDVQTCVLSDLSLNLNTAIWSSGYKLLLHIIEVISPNTIAVIFFFVILMLAEQFQIFYENFCLVYIIG